MGEARVDMLQEAGRVKFTLRYDIYNILEGVLPG